VAQVEQTPFSVAVVRNNPANNSTQGATTFNTTGLRLIIKVRYRYRYRSRRQHCGCSARRHGYMQSHT
jgi:hypothetical protein